MQFLFKISEVSECHVYFPFASESDLNSYNKSYSSEMNLSTKAFLKYWFAIIKKGEIVSSNTLLKPSHNLRRFKLQGFDEYQIKL